MYWYIGKPKHTDQYIDYNFHLQTTCKESVLSSLFNRAYSINKNQDDLTKENTSVKKENGYPESIRSKIFKRVNNNCN